MKNIGNTDIKPTLTLKIASLDDKTVHSNTTVAMVFPENTGELNNVWQETPAFGIYRLTAVVNILKI